VSGQTYARPNEEIFLATREWQMAGGRAYRTIARVICEMKRLFGCDWLRKVDLGKRLCEVLTERARADGFLIMKLDTAISRLDVAWSPPR
jgi:hypothetical protein